MRYIIALVLMFASSTSFADGMYSDTKGDTYYVTDGGTGTTLVQDAIGNTQSFVSLD